MTGSALADLGTRVGPVLIFLVAITVVAEIADAAGIFDVAGHLLLPVSNMTNLLALHRLSALEPGRSGYVSLAVWPALAATLAVLTVIHRRDLRGHYTPEAPPAPQDKTLLIVPASLCAALGPAFAIGITPPSATSVAALLLVGTCLVRNRPLLRAVCSPAWSAVATGHQACCGSAPLEPAPPTRWTTCPRRAGITISAWRFARQGAVCAITATAAATLGPRVGNP